MTSGNFHHGPIASILVDRESRQRRDLINIEELAESIEKHGLIHPILVTRDMRLVAGERRLAAHRHLGRETITYQFTDEVDAGQLQAIELAENIKRVDLSWQDRVRTVQAYHNLQLSTNPDWTSDDTGEGLGLDGSTIRNILGVAREIEKGNTKILSAPKLSTAQNLLARRTEREQQAELATLFDDHEPEQDFTILTGDFREWAPAYRGPAFNFIHCDFPYGINVDKSAQANAAGRGDYEDSPEVYWELIGTLLSNLDTLMTPTGHILFWYAAKFYTETRLALSQSLTVNPVPLIWHRSDNSGILPDPARGPRQIYETALLCSHGDAKIVQAVGNLFPHPSAGEAHMSEKPQGMLQHFFRMTVDHTTRMLDPTCGAGSAIRACETLGGKALGLELNPEYAQIARDELNNDRIKRNAKS